MKANREQWEVENLEMDRRFPQIKLSLSPMIIGMIINCVSMTIRNPTLHPEKKRQLEEIARGLMKAFPPEMLNIHARFDEELKGR